MRPATTWAGRRCPHRVAVAPGGPGQTANRDAFARDLFGTIPNLKDVHVNSAEPLRLVASRAIR